MFRPTLLFAFLTLTTAEFFYAGNDCRVSISHKTGDLQDPQPLLLTPNAKEFAYPSNQTQVFRIPRGQSIYLACPGKGNYLQNLSTIQETAAVCVRDKIFSIDGVPRNFSSLTCKFMPRHDAIRVSRKCLKNYTTIEIGFQLKNDFIKTLEVCRDDKTLSTFYSKFTMTKAIEHYQTGYPRPSAWIIGDYFPGLHVDNYYKFYNQEQTIARILNSTELAKKYLKKSAQFLARGHMSARADFVYGAQQRTTFWHMNAAPQWQSCNGGNWNTLEDNVRSFVKNRKLTLEVYTGLHGQMTLPNEQGEPQAIHLYSNGTHTALRVPRFYWKIIYDPVSMRGTAFVSLNDPYITKITEDVFLCEDISSKINWLNWKPNDIWHGVSYACTIDDLRRAVPTIPEFKVVDILV